MAERKYVKLNFVRHESEITTIDGYEAEDWGDFLVVSIDASNLSPEEVNYIQQTFAEHTEGFEKKVIIVPKDLDLSFYGVEAVND